MPTNPENLSWREKIHALKRVARFRPKFTFLLIGFGGIVAVFEGIGLGFIYPIIEVAQAEGTVEANDPIMQGFLTVYETVGLPFTMGYLILGIALIMTFRYIVSFILIWVSAILQYTFEKEMRSRALDAALDARIKYFDQEGSDDILNAIITETRYSGKVISQSVKAMQTFLLATIYFAIMLFIAPFMTLLAFVLLVGITVVIRYGIEPAFTVGSRVAQANENVQEAVQAGTQGIRDVKLFGLLQEVYGDFSRSVDRYMNASIDLARNEAAVKEGYSLSAALTLFVLVYIGFVYSGLSLAALGIFLFAMFQLAPKASSINKYVYRVEGNLSHLVRTYEFIDELYAQREMSGDRSIDTIESIEFDNVRFRYTDDERVFEGISFELTRGEFIAFVGQSGAGKSTIVTLLTRMYDPQGGVIRANGVPIQEYDLEQWRGRIAVVRQNPFIFNDTLKQNITIGNRETTPREIERVCEIAKVDEFLDDLPNGLDSQLGDDGVRLSGGQRQRVALARALLKDADFLILDEATSDLDSNLEREVQRAIESMDREYGIIAIAHRLSTVENADRIHTLERGEITETGTHGELVEDEGKYAELYAIQSAG